MIALLIACTSPSKTDTAISDSSSSEFAVLAMAALDYSVGSLARFDLESHVQTDDISSISGDAVVVYDADLLWQLNRYQYDTIRKYDPSNLIAPIQEVSVAPPTGSSNPHDVAVCDNKLFVSLYEEPYVLVLNIDTLEEAGRIDISSYADADGQTEASSLVKHQERLYLGLQGLDRNNNYIGVGSTILEIDCDSEQIANSWPLGNNIDLNTWVENDSMLFHTEALGDFSGGIYRFEPTTGQTEPIVTVEEDLITGLAVKSQSLVYLTAAADYSAYTVHCFDTESGTQTNAGSFIEFLTQVQLSTSGEAWVTAHWGWNDLEAARPGLYGFDAETCQQMDDSPFEFNLAPVSIALVESNN